MNSLQRRGLVNASVAAVATFAIGSAVVYAAGGPEDVATPPHSTSPSASPGFALRTTSQVGVHERVVGEADGLVECGGVATSSGPPAA